MNSWLTKSISLIAIELLLVIPNCGGWSGAVLSKSTEDYWARTQLDSHFLQDLLQDKYCYNKEIDFLSCVNAISQMVQKQNLFLNYNGELRPLSKLSLRKRMTEKSELQMWKRFYQRQILGNSQPGNNGNVSSAGTPNHLVFNKIADKFFEQYVNRSEKAYYVSIGINGYLSVAMDPHTYILPIEMYEDSQSIPENKNTGMGLVARRSLDKLVIRKVFEKSPAAVAGLKKGDRIISFNNIEISILPTSKLNDFLRMKEKDRVLVQAERNGKPVVAEIIKAENSVPNVLVQWIEQSKGLGLITINRFTNDTCEMVKSEIKKLKAWGLSGLVLDLRDNPGGQVEEAACVTGLFIKKGKLLFETRYLDASKKTDFYFSKEAPLFTGPLVTLINSGTASAAEIVAGSLKDLSRTTLMGEKSFGKGSFQDGKVWGQNQKIVLFETQGFYYFPSGWTPQLVGLTPDIEVKFSAIDPQREEDLYLSPLRPYDYWNGPQSLSWLYTQNNCVQKFDNAQYTDGFNPSLAFTEFNEDPQLRSALTFITCQGSNDKNDSI